MHALAIGSSPDDPGLPDDGGASTSLVIAGTAGSSLRATATALIVCPARLAPGREVSPARTWSYRRLSRVRLDEGAPLSMIRGTVRATGAELPLLLVERDEVAAARRVLEVVGNLIRHSMHEDDAA